jgi:hypothetical protein
MKFIDVSPRYLRENAATMAAWYKRHAVVVHTNIRILVFEYR